MIDRIQYLPDNEGCCFPGKTYKQNECIPNKF